MSDILLNMDDNHTTSSDPLSQYSPNQVIKPGEKPATKETPSLLDWQKHVPPQGSVITMGQKSQTAAPGSPDLVVQKVKRKHLFKWLKRT